MVDEKNTVINTNIYKILREIRFKFYENIKDCDKDYRSLFYNSIDLCNSAILNYINAYNTINKTLKSSYLNSVIDLLQVISLNVEDMSKLVLKVNQDIFSKLTFKIGECIKSCNKFLNSVSNNDS